MTTAHALTCGCFYAVGNLLSNLLDPFGFTPRDIALFGITLTVFGVISAVVISKFVDKTAKYKTTLNTLLVCCAIMAFVCIYVLYLHIKWLLMLCLLIYGIGNSGFRPVSFSFSVELTFPM